MTKNLTLSKTLPPENIRKPDGFLFSDCTEKVHWEQMG